MPSPRRTLPCLALLGMAALAGAALAPACTCATPSAEIDGSDLLNVFARDAGSDGAPDGGVRQGRGKHREGGASAATDASAAPAASVRTPPEGACAAVEGAPDRDIRRTLGRP